MICKVLVASFLLTSLPAIAVFGAEATSTRVAHPEWQRDATPELGRQGHRANQSSRRDAGSASTLHGAVLLYHVFVSDPESSWTEKKKLGVGSRINEALQFVEAQAARYDARPHFMHVIAGPVTLDKPISLAAQANPGWTGHAIRAASGTNARGVVAQYRKSHEADHVLIVLHVNKTARSYNISFYKGVPVNFSAERLVCFTNIAPEMSTPPATYAHEILHGFGAGDLYFPFDQDDSRYLKAKAICPNDVMFRVDPDISQLEVAPWTAFRVGWTKKLPDEYAFMDDGG